MFDSHPNLATGTVQVPPIQPTTGQTFKLFPGQAGAFEPNMPVTLAPPLTMPDADNSEIGYLTAIAGDTLTIQRAQEGSIPKIVVPGWRVYGTITRKTITDIEEAVAAIPIATDASIAVKGIIQLAGDLGGTAASPTVPGLITLQDQINTLSHVPMDITSLANTVGTAEIGSTVSSVTFNWTRNKVPATLSFDQGIGSITASLLTLTQSVNITGTTTYTLTANDGTAYTGNSDTASTTVTFSHKAYWGTSASTSLNSAGVLGLATNTFTTTRARSFVIDGGGQYLYYAYPASFGAATFTVNGLLSTAWTLSVLSFTNASGNTTNFNVYRSDTIQNGTGIQVGIS